MTDKYQNRYRIQSTRLEHWDYSSAGYYFVTICTQNRINCFGRIHRDAKSCVSTVELSDIGNIAKECWQNIPVHFPRVALDEFIIMPNHVHGIIRINNVETQGPVETQSSVETQNFASLQKYNKFGPQSMNLGSIIRGYKVGVKKWATTNNIDFQWQPGFYEHVIRDENSLANIRRYIIENPLKWELDPENTVETQGPVETQNFASLRKLSLRNEKQ